jgi:hypothetical protein
MFDIHHSSNFELYSLLMGMAATAITATGAAVVSAPIHWPVVIAPMIQMSSVKEIDHRATGKKGTASQKNKRQKKFFHAVSSFLCVAVPLRKKWRTPEEGEQECAQRFRCFLCNVLWEMRKTVEAHSYGKKSADSVLPEYKQGPSQLDNTL